MNRFLDYLSRIGKSKGFGIQSPWAYSFVREVIYEQLNYYAYSDLEIQYNDKKNLKKQKLYFRLKNFSNNNFHVFDIKGLSLDQFNAEFNSLKENSIICIENIYSCQTAFNKWESIKQLQSVGITFDLYDLAICFTRNDMFKQHYKLNF